MTDPREALSAKLLALPRYNCDCLPQNRKGEMSTYEQSKGGPDCIHCERDVVLWEDVAALLLVEAAPPATIKCDCRIEDGYPRKDVL